MKDTMSEGLNRVTLFGNLGADPDLRITQGGLAILHLRLATTDGWFDREKQERQQRTQWHAVTVFGARAEALARLLKKGEAVLVEGALHTSSYEKDGVRRYRTEVVAREVCLTGKRRAAPVEVELAVDDTDEMTGEVVPVGPPLSKAHPALNGAVASA